MAEILVRPENVAYVQGSPGENEEEYFFDLILENAQERAMIYFFVLAHGFDVGDEAGTPHVH